MPEVTYLPSKEHAMVIGTEFLCVAKVKTLEAAQGGFLQKAKCLEADAVMCTAFISWRNSLMSKCGAKINDD